MNKSIEIKELLLALLEVQKNISPVAMHGFNPHFKSKFSKLGDILDELKRVCLPLGLVISQLPSMQEVGEQVCVVVETVVMHAQSGQWLSADVSCPAPVDAQKVGASITYLRRFGLVSLFCLKEEDDDGEALNGRSPEKDFQPKKVPSNLLAILLQMIMSKNIGADLQAQWCKHFNVTGLGDLDDGQLQRLINTLEKRV